MSIRSIEFTKPVFHKETYNYGSHLDTILSYLTKCPNGHDAGRVTKTLDLSVTDPRNGPLWSAEYGLRFQCPTCGVFFGWTDEDREAVRKLLSSFRVLMGK